MLYILAVSDPGPWKSDTVWKNGLVSLLAIAGLFLAGVACTGPDGALPDLTRTEGEPLTAVSTAPSPDADGALPDLTRTEGEPLTAVFTGPSPDDSTWVLQVLDGSAPIEGTFAWLKLAGDTYSGADGCNTFGGRSEGGTPVAGGDGSFTAPPSWSTAMLCEAPAGIMDQADSYFELLKEGRSFRIVDDRMEILDGRGDTRLIFDRQAPLSGRPVDLTGTGWQLVVEDNGGEEVRAATQALVDDRVAVGTTACRGYVALYMTSDGGLDFPTTSMTEYTATCSEEMWEHEGRFGDDLSQAVEYSVSEEEGTRRLGIRTSRGRTLLFEPLSESVDSVFGIEWHLKAFVDPGQGDSDIGLFRVTSLIQGTQVTIRFGQDGAGGSGGCNSYASQPESGGYLVNDDGSIDIRDDIFWTLVLCPNPAGIMEQEERYLELVPMFERLQIYGNLLVVHTMNDLVLLFQAE